MSVQGSKIELTVALPLYRARDIAWLALESLCRQKEINFHWELVAAEEIREDAFGKKALDSYRERLRNIGCERIKYIALSSWIPLSRKCRLIALRSFRTSRFLVFQDADGYSQPRRLKDTYDLFQRGADWIQSRKGIFFNIVNGQTGLYDFDENPPGKFYKTAMDMAVKAELIRRIPDDGLRCSIDNWLYENCQAVNGRLEVLWNETEHWQHGLHTDGLSTISITSPTFYACGTFKAPFVRNPIDVTKYIPADILSRLRECRKYAEVREKEQKDGCSLKTNPDKAKFKDRIQYILQLPFKNAFFHILQAILRRMGSIKMERG